MLAFLELEVLLWRKFLHHLGPLNYCNFWYFRNWTLEQDFVHPLRNPKLSTLNPGGMVWLTPSQGIGFRVWGQGNLAGIPGAKY